MINRIFLELGGLEGFRIFRIALAYAIKKEYHVSNLLKVRRSMIGIDLIRTDRMKRFMERFGDKALLRFLSSDEIRLVKNHKTAAGFWAAKEACSKALGTGISRECSFHDIVISKTERGAPEISLSKHLVESFDVSDLSVSITHDGEYAVAVVAIEGEKNSNL